MYARSRNLLLAAILCLWPSLLLGQTVVKRLPTAALIDQEGDVVAGLLEAKLLAANQAKWLERNDIKQILEEQKLDAAFGAAGGNQRLSLGKLLKADLLVMIRRVSSADDDGKKFVECVVCETKQGLRLRIAYAPAGKEEESAAEAFRIAFDDAIRKYHETTHEIVAVPPLVSDNLSFEKNYLQSAYAKLIEQALLEQPGVVVVELGEAQAIAREAAIAAEDQPVQRDRLPLYLLGNFRHTGRGDATRVSVELRLKRGDIELGERSHKQLTPQHVGAWLADASLELLQDTRKVAVAKASPKSEAKQLAQRAMEFFRIGNWEESLALLEASLLLEPDQQQLHHHAVIACGKLIPSVKFYGEPKEQITKAVAVYLRGLEHLEAFTRTADAMETYSVKGQGDFVSDFEGRTSGWNMPTKTPDDIREIVNETLAIRRETYLRITRFRFAAGFKDEFWLARAVQSVDGRARLDLAVQLLEEFRDRPDLQKFGVHLALHVGDRKTAEYQQFLDRLAQSKFAEVREVATNTRSTMARIEADQKVLDSKRAPEITDVVKEIVPTPITFTLGGRKMMDQLKKTDQLPLGCVPAGEGRDVFFGQGVLYLMQERGDLQVLWRSTERNCSPRSVVYDGRYVWASYHRHRRSPGILVVDLEAPKVIHFTQEDGLPGDDQEHDLNTPSEVVRLAALAPGRVCMVGSLGRAWIGIATFDGAKKSLPIIHEAREAANNAEPHQGKETSVEFQPTMALTLRDRDAQGELIQTVVVPRLTANLAARSAPLLVNVAREEVRVADFPMWAEGEGGRIQPEAFSAVVDGKLIIDAFNPQLREPELLSVSAGDTTAKVILNDPPDGFYVAQGSELHIIGKQWWVFDTKAQKLRVAGSPSPWIFNNRWVRKNVSHPLVKQQPEDCRLERVHVSNHYGVVAWTISYRHGWQLFEGVRAK